MAWSSAEAEYKAMAQATAEVTWLISLLQLLGVHHLKPVTLHCDNQSALATLCFMKKPNTWRLIATSPGTRSWKV